MTNDERNPNAQKPILLIDLWDGLHFVSPHPGPLPRGEGESCAACWRGRSRGLWRYHCVTTSLRTLFPLPEGTAVELRGASPSFSSPSSSSSSKSDWKIENENEDDDEDEGPSFVNSTAVHPGPFPSDGRGRIMPQAAAN